MDEIDVVMDEKEEKPADGGEAVTTTQSMCRLAVGLEMLGGGDAMVVGDGGMTFGGAPQGCAQRVTTVTDSV